MYYLPRRSSLSPELGKWAFDADREEYSNFPEALPDQKGVRNVESTIKSLVTGQPGSSDDTRKPAADCSLRRYENTRETVHLTTDVRSRKTHLRHKPLPAEATAELKESGACPQATLPARRKFQAEKGTEARGRAATALDCLWCMCQQFWRLTLCLQEKLAVAQSNRNSSLEERRTKANLVLQRSLEVSLLHLRVSAWHF